MTSQCISDKTFSDIDGKLASIVQWKLDIPFDLNLEQYLELKCDRCLPGLKKLMPTILETNPVMIYHDCLANNYTSMRRDCIALPTHDDVMVERFSRFVDRIFDTEILPILDGFEYSHNAYYNHLTATQQKRFDNVDKDSLNRRAYGNFCKLEKQEITSSDKHPKNRNISSPNEEYKFVAGPIVYRLEQIFKKKFKGYASGRSWNQREAILNARASSHLTQLVQGDGSGFDRTQYAALKRVCEMRIYKHLADAGIIYHCTETEFLEQMMAETVTFNVRQMGKSGKYAEVIKLGKVIKTGTVQSGNCDTTFGNTLRMVLYNRFVVEELIGLDPFEYDLDCAGDDFAVFMAQDIPIDLIRWAYYTVFRPQIKGEDDSVRHGLGQILKYLRISDIEGCDFCSTETYWSPTLNSYKIIRKIDRYLTLTPWSRKALQLSQKEQREYMKQLAIANDEWVGDLPILSDYNNIIRNYDNYYSHKFNRDVKSTKGIKKKYKPLERSHYQDLYDQAHAQRFDQLVQIFGTDDAYAMMDRVSDKKHSEADFENYLTRKYGISRSEIRHMQLSIQSMANMQLNETISLPTFKVMTDGKIIFEASQCHDHLLFERPIWEYTKEQILLLARVGTIPQN